MTASRAAVLAAIAVAGCYDDTPGLRLIIRDPGFNPDHVELFISTRGADFEYMGPDQARTTQRDKLKGTSFFLDGPGDGITPLTRLAFTGKRVVWDLQAEGDGPSHVKLLVAVAFDANNTAVAIAMMQDFEVPANDTIAAVLDLEPAMQMPPSEDAQPEGIRVWPWRKTNAAAAACLGLEYSDGRNVKERKWLVPEDDPDCDEVELECDKYLYHADYSEIATTCIVPPSNSGQTHIPCKLGTKVCEDGVSAGECNALANPPYCIASALCDPDLCFGDATACAQKDSSRVACDMAIDADGALCDGGTVGMGPLSVTMSAGNVFPGGCQAVAFAVSDMTSGYVSSPTATAGGATFHIETLLMPSCTFSIVAGDAFDKTMLAGQPLILVLDVTRTGAHLLVPVFITLHPGACANESPGCLPMRGPTPDLGVCAS